MTDKDFLQWIHNRLIYVYRENENVDFLHRLRKIISEQETKNESD
jgi:hypothetical protein